MNSICFNGKIVSGTEPVLMASNRGYRYGDGLFETMKLSEGRILLQDYHFERLFSGLQLLRFDIPVLFTKEKIIQDIGMVARKNQCEKLARVRLSVFRGNGGLYDDDDKTLQYLVECWPLTDEVNKLNEDGLVIDIYPDAEKSCDHFSNMKSANFLPYSMGALFAKANELNDCLVVNNRGNIADSTIANIFIITDGFFSTPSLEEGCVNGVMRRHLIAQLRAMGYEVQESQLTINDLLNADEAFLTNAIQGMQWVKQFRDKRYSHIRTADLYNRLFTTIHA